MNRWERLDIGIRVFIAVTAGSFILATFIFAQSQHQLSEARKLEAEKVADLAKAAAEAVQQQVAEAEIRRSQALEQTALLGAEALGPVPINRFPIDGRCDSSFQTVGAGSWVDATT